MKIKLSFQLSKQPKKDILSIVFKLSVVNIWSKWKSICIVSVYLPLRLLILLAYFAKDQTFLQLVAVICFLVRLTWAQIMPAGLADSVRECVWGWDRLELVCRQIMGVYIRTKIFSNISLFKNKIFWISSLIYSNAPLTWVPEYNRYLKG